MSRFKPHLRILPRQQRALWPHLAPAKELGFVLYGGTAITLRLGHRESVDFDFFTEKPLGKAEIYAAMPLLKKGEVLQEGPDTLAISVTPPGMADPVKVSFLAMIAFGRCGEPELTEDGVLRVASLDDLMATKLKVILDRTEKKDYDDLASLIDSGMDVPRGLAVARKLFPQLNPQIVLKALAYHDDIKPKLSAKSRKLLIDGAKSVNDLPEVKLRSKSLGHEGTVGKD